MTKRYLFFFALSSFILTVIWLVTNAYHSHASSTIEPLLKTQIEPIDPGFDQKTITELRSRNAIEPLNSPVAISEIEDPEAQTSLEESVAESEETPPLSPAPAEILEEEPALDPPVQEEVAP